MKKAKVLVLTLASAIGFLLLFLLLRGPATSPSDQPETPASKTATAQTTSGVGATVPSLSAATNDPSAWLAALLEPVNIPYAQPNAATQQVARPPLAAAGQSFAGKPAFAWAWVPGSGKLPEPVAPPQLIPDGFGGKIAIDLSTDEARNRTVAALATMGKRQRAEAEAKAKLMGWPLVKQLTDGSKVYLDRLENGEPVYQGVFNYYSALSSNVVAIRQAAPYNLSGQYLDVAVWDGGKPDVSHPEYGGSDGFSRVHWNELSIAGSGTDANHPTHVCGTIGAKGISSYATGMAPECEIMARSFNDATLTADIAAGAAAVETQASWNFAPGNYLSRFMVSNHSYGVHYDTNPSLAGDYDSSSATYDAILFAAPFHLACVSAGNDQSKRTNGWETISGKNGAKNILSVGACEDAVSLGSDLHYYRDLTDLAITSFSSLGPEDDGRLKPDVVCNGDNLYSAAPGGGYIDMSGTSMACPSATGAVVLLQEQALLKLHRGLRASTMKGLLMHTADDVGNQGPDYKFGYGLVNAQRAADMIAEAEAKPWSLREGVLATGVAEMDEFFVMPDAAKYLKATLCWTDPAGPAQADNSTTPVLVHDLDLRLISPSDSESRPWTLSRTNPGGNAGHGDDNVNNVEQVATGTITQDRPWKVRVTHKGTLTESYPLAAVPFGATRNYLQRNPTTKSQVFSLLISGAAGLGTLTEALDDTTAFYTSTDDHSAIGWGWENTESHLGGSASAAVSPLLLPGQRTGLERNVTGPGTLTYWAKTNGAATAGLSFWSDGIQVVPTVQGVTDWTKYTFFIPSAGNHVVRWQYSIPSNVAPDHSSAWLDEIYFLPKPVITSASGTSDFVQVNFSFSGRSIKGGTVYRNSTPSLTGATSSNVWSSSGNATGNGLAYVSNGTGRYFAVEAWDTATNQTSLLSDWFLATLQLGFIQSFSASNGIYSDKIVLTWSAVPGADQYVVTRTPAGGSSTTITLGAVTTYTDTAAVTPGQVVTYTVKGRRVSDGAESFVSTDTGYRLDPATVSVAASDGTGPAVNIVWPGAFWTEYRVLRTTSAGSPTSGNAYITVPTGNTSGTDSTTVPGVTYWYWVQQRTVGTNDPWGDYGSDTGYAAAPPDVNYAISTSDNIAGPQFQWIDASMGGEKIAGQTLIKPISALMEAGTAENPIYNVINDTGLSGSARLASYIGTTHSTAQADRWNTTASGSNYFNAGGVQPKIIFDLGAAYKVSDLVVWGIAGSADEAKTFLLEPVYFDSVNTHQWQVWPTGQSVTVSTPAATAGKAVRIPLTGSPFSNDGHQFLRVTITANRVGEGLSGGGRVALGELRFLGTGTDYGQYPQLQMFSANYTLVDPSLHGYLGGQPDNGSDSTNDTTLPATPDLGANGFRLYPYHDALDTARSGGVFYQSFTNNPHPHGSPAETLKVWQWQDAHLAGHPEAFSFQVLVFGTSGDIIFQYLPGNPGGDSATIGLQDKANNKAVLYAANKPGSIPRDRNFSILFRKQAPATAQPATLTVTTLTDEDNGSLGGGTGISLREAFKYSPSGSTIVFPLSMAGQTLQLNSELPLGNTSLTLDGSTAPGLVLSGRGLNRVINSVGALTLKNLTIDAGKTTSNHGGGIYHGGSVLTLENVTISNCQSTTGFGGGIYAANTTTVVMRNCTVSGCSAVGGGGIWMAAAAGVGQRSVNFTIIGCTFTANAATTNGGGGIYNGGLTTDSYPERHLVSSIVAGNASTTSGPDFLGITGSDGYNLFSSTAGMSGLSPNDIVSATPGLSALANNGGPVKTHAILPTSPAVDAAAGPGGGYFLLTDARGIPRGADGDSEFPVQIGSEISLAGAVATQSSENPGFPAPNGIDGNLSNFTHTSPSDSSPAWTLTLPSTNAVSQIVLYNRGDGCCQERFKDLTIRAYSDAAATNVIYTSPVINPGNVLSSPAVIPVSLNGVSARVIRVSKNSTGTDAGILSLGEVKLYGVQQDLVSVSLAGAVATQSTTFNCGPGCATPDLAIDGDFTSISHTEVGDFAPWWKVTLSATTQIDEVVVTNRIDCCPYRLKDVTVTVYSDAAATVPVFTSTLLNPGNILNGPVELRVPMGITVNARAIKVARTVVNGDAEPFLSVGELVINRYNTRRNIGGPDIGAYELQAPLIVTTAADTLDPADGKLSLREAVLQAGADGGGTIKFNTTAMGGSTITLTSQLNVSAYRGLVIEGSSRPAAATFTVLGTGTAALLGSDLTDPENDGVGTGGTKGTKFNWLDVTTSDTSQAYFNDGTGGFAEGALEVFDNQLGANAKWCCAAAPQQVTVRFAKPVTLSHFTISSSNDTPSRDPLDWQILGSNDGANFTPIFTQSGNTSLWSARNQVVLVTLPNIAPPYSFIRYAVSRTGGTQHALGELEFFGPSPDRLTISGGNATRHFQVDGGRLELRNLNLINGSTTNSGGSILNKGELAIMACELRGNNSGLGGGALRNEAGAMALLDSSTIYNNTAATGANGGAISSSGRVEITQSTISGNTADGGGGIGLTGGSAHLVSSTVSNNTSRIAANGAVNNAGASLKLESSIVANDSTTQEIIGSFTQDGSCLLGGDAMLGPLGSYGGLIPVHPLLANSAAIDHGRTSEIPLTSSSDAVTPAASNSAIGSETSKAFDGNPTTAWSSIDPSLVAWWPLDTGTQELVAGRTGAATGAVSFSQSPATGLSGSSVSYASDLSGKITVPYASALNPTSFTVSCWAYPTLVDSNYHNVITNRESSPFRGFIIYLDVTNRWTFEVEGTTVSYLYGNTAFANNWYHLAATYDAPTQTAQFYVNGSLRATATTPMTLNPSAAFRIGDAYAGKIDDVSLWRTALSASEIQALQARGVQNQTRQLTVRPANPLLAAHALRVTSGNGPATDDPASYILEGSRDGETFLELARDTIAPFAARNTTQTLHFTARSGWPYYRVAFPTAQGGPAAARLSVAEVEILNSPVIDERGLERWADGNGDDTFQSDIGAVEARTLIVTTATDGIDGPGNGGFSLREALQPVHMADNILFSETLNGQTIRLATAQGGQNTPLSISRYACISATNLPNGITIDAGGRPSAVSVPVGGYGYLEALTLTGAVGPGLDNAGTAWLQRCTVTGNAATSTSGGLRNTGNLTVHTSTISGNAAGTGSGGGIGNTGTLGVYFTTITGNSASNGGGIAHSGTGTASIWHSIISGNTSAGSRDMAGTAASAGFNLIGVSNGSTGWTASDRTGLIGSPLDAKLGALTSNGGPTRTHTPLAGSPALNAGDPTLFALYLTDQRGQSRIASGIADIGAVEQAAVSRLGADTDGDGMTDDWERFYGLNPNSAADGAQDADGDGQSNASEFLAGTVPTSAASRLRISAFSANSNLLNGKVLDITWESVPGIVYSLWNSANLTNWTPISGANIVAIASTTHVKISIPASNRGYYRVQVGAADGAGAAHEPPPDALLAPVSDWATAGLTSGGAGTTISQWLDAAVGGDTLLPNASPTLRLAVTPTGKSAVEFRGSTFNDALASNVPAGKYALTNATSFTAICVFKPDGDSENSVGTQFWNKAQLLNADISGAGNDWGLSYGSDAIWFGVGAGSGAGTDASISVPAGTGMVGKWWIALATWTANDGSGKPSYSTWLFDANGQQIAQSGYIDPNTTAATTGRYNLPRANTGIAIGGARGNLSGGNFDGHIAAAQLYNVYATPAIASDLAQRLSVIYTSTAAPQ